MSSHPRVRLVPATVSLLNALTEDRARFGELVGSSVPDGWPEFPEAIAFTLQHLRTAPEADRPWSMQLFVDHETGRLLGSGGIALGHPIGATGTRIMATLLNELERTGGRYGLQTMCEGGGQANVTIIERL